MTDSTAALKSLKQAANYSKLAMRELGPRSFKRGQGALVKVIYKFGGDDGIDKKELERILGWRSGEVREVAEKACDNGYVEIDDSGFEFKVSLTDKGLEVIKKRMAVEDRAADEVLSGLSPEEVAQLVALADKVSETCRNLGIDYSLIAERRSQGSPDEDDPYAADDEMLDECCFHVHQDAPRFVFVFEDGSHHHHHGGCEEGPDGFGRMPF